ncbi:MAG: hypothetical protein KF692_08980 [Cryobacterium sp.]|nr:hypothetical protein [Cryobacterium sp.]
MCCVNETLRNSDPTSTPPSGGEQRIRQRWYLPAWMWSLITAIPILLLAIIAVLLVTLHYSSTGTTQSATAPSPTAPAPTATATAEEPTPTASALDNAVGTFDSDMRSKIADILNSQNTAVFAQDGLFSDPVEVFVVGGDDSWLTPSEAALAIGFNFTPDDPYAWDLNVPEVYLTAYRGTVFGEFFPDGAIVARSHDKRLVSFLGHGSTITKVFVAASEGAMS